MEHLSEIDAPLVTIGMPVYNGAKSIKKALDSLLNQTFTNFELIISDNASTDKTEEICKTYAAKDVRIKYIRQLENIGYVANFKYLLMDVQGDYFMWAAADDIRSLDYLELNYSFLERNLNYVASGSPNGFENWPNDKKLVNFSIEEDEAFDRVVIFFKNCFQSHGLFYCLFRTKTITDCKILDKIFPVFAYLGNDWATILYLSTQGKINRTSEGNIIFGVHGVSSNSNIFKKFNRTEIENFIPFYVLSRLVLIIVKNFSNWQKLQIIYILVKLNIFVIIDSKYQSIKSLLYIFYCKYLKSTVKKL